MTARPPPVTIRNQLRKARENTAGELKDGTTGPSRKGQTSGPPDKPRAG